jgi:hypothetical protein
MIISVSLNTLRSDLRSISIIAGHLYRSNQKSESNNPICEEKKMPPRVPIVNMAFGPNNTFVLWIDEDADRDRVPKYRR